MSTQRHGLGVSVLEGPIYAVGEHDSWSYMNIVKRWVQACRKNFAKLFSLPGAVSMAVQLMVTTEVIVPHQ
jgi:hypothetical protein